MSTSRMPIRLQALGDLMKRYWMIGRMSWGVRHQLAVPVRHADELAFLPANLELMDSPVHPAPRWLMRSIMGLALITLLIAIFGRLDIVAVAKGKLLPDAHVKVIQPAITGVVRQIYVRDGQRVNAGDRLIQLDATQAAADSDKARLDRINASLTAARSQALLNIPAGARRPRVSKVDGATTEQQAQAESFALGLYSAYQEKLHSAQAELAKRQAELGTTRQEIAKLEATAPIARQQANQYKSLIEQKYVSMNDYLDKESTAQTQEHELAAQRAHVAELTAGIVQQQAEIAATTAQFRSDQLTTLDKATQQLEQSRNDETKADTRQQLLTLTAPVAGTVQQLSLHTLGGLATAASSIMEIVPDDTIEVEANIENKDIGFVRVGQTANVKIEAFPYARYGYLTGTVESVSNDAVQDKKSGLTFVTRVKLPTNTINANGRLIHLTPGMAVTAEIKTGKQSVAHYLLDPVITTAQESMRER